MTTEAEIPYFDPRTLARLRGLPLRARHVVDGYVAGPHRSPFRGFSIEFSQHREYAPGDDLRYVDWKVFGRTDKYFVKQFEDETNLVCYLIVDASASMSYRGPGSTISKWEYAQCLAASMAWLVLHQQDAVSLATFNDKVESHVPASNMAAHLQPLLGVLEASSPRRQTRIDTCCRELAPLMNRRGVVVFISDLLGSINEIGEGLRQLRLRRHDVRIVQLLDDAEVDFPFDRPMQFRGLEDNASVITDAAALKESYQAELHRRLSAISSCSRDLEIEYRMFRTSTPVDAPLSYLLSTRPRGIR